MISKAFFQSVDLNAYVEIKALKIRLFFWFYKILYTIQVQVIIFLFLECTSLDTSLHISLHISPHGKDVVTCGNLTQKCRTIDYAVNKAIGDNIIFILETNSVESQTYNVSRSIRCNIHHLRIKKDKIEGINPTIRGCNNQAFIQQKKNKLNIKIDSVHLINFSLLNSSNNDVTDLSILINNCTIKRTTPTISSFISIMLEKEKERDDYYWYWHYYYKKSHLQLNLKK